jgi:hypothetical protein
MLKCAVVVFLFHSFIFAVLLFPQQSYGIAITPGTDCTRGTQAPVSQYSISLANLPGGSYADDSLSPHFVNLAGSVLIKPYWTPTPQKYLIADDYTRLSIQSKYCSRDMEVDTWVRNGLVFLRKTDDGKAIYFYHNGEVSPAGYIEIGIVTNLTEGVGFRYTGGNFYTIYSGNLQKVPGYDRSNTQDAHFTFGIQGFDIYAKLNGVEFARFKDYRHMASGRVALQANNGYGFRDITVRNFASQSLYSNYVQNVLDLRDFDVRDVQTTGSILKDAKVLTVKKSLNFKVGDYVIVETDSVPGTKGVGGTWPVKSYATVATMNADRLQTDTLYAWVEENGNVYRWTNGMWQQQTNYYLAKAIPLALQARITAISGNSLVLDKPAAVTIHNVNVYLDNSYVFNKLARDPRYDGESNFPDVKDGGYDFSAIIPANITLHFPAGNFAVGRLLLLSNHNGWIVEGADKASTRIFSPKGTPSSMILVDSSASTKIRNLHLQGNARDSGYGLQWSPNFLRVTQTEVEQGWGFPSGILFKVSHGSQADDLNVTDVFQKAVGTAFSDGVWANRINNVMTDGLRTYVQWQFQWTDSSGGGCVDCSVTSPYLIAGFEAFKSRDVQFIRPVGTNATMAMNAAGNFSIQDARLIVKSMSQHPDRTFSEYNPLININSNINQKHPYLALGGTINNATMIQEGYINANNDILRGIVVNVHNPLIRINGGFYQAPNYRSPSKLNGPSGVGSTGADTIVDGIKVVATVNTTLYPIGNIHVDSGIVRNCIADVIAIGANATVENCHTNTGSPSAVIH